ncbi:hypothetical protein L2E82_28205 [Cichorium intybus]|uniref:Uncharacterized protein n=1 Tax=Cichorium intybus TaxID=13427 RepID=A0ACB9CVD8_CICIN|nr:hypothetical protein L2E82_28205 [Cichorium intybus]
MSCPKLGVSTTFDQSGLIPSPEVVEQLLKRFINAGMLVLQMCSSKDEMFSSNSARSHQPSDGISKVVFRGQVTNEEVESLNKSGQRVVVQEKSKEQDLPIENVVTVQDQNQCTNTGFMCLENKNKRLLLKELKYLWKNEDSSLPWYEGEYSSSNTLLITDPVKALGNPPNTAIFPEKYDAENNDDEYLGLDGELRAFLVGLAEAKDVQSYLEDHPFGKPAISSSHSDWGYYSEIIYSCVEEDEFCAQELGLLFQSNDFFWHELI